MSTANTQSENIKTQPKSSRKEVPAIIEIYVWLIFAFIISLRLIIASQTDSFSQIIYHFYWDLVISIFVSLFPIIFKLTFSEFPFEYIRNRKISNKIEDVLTSIAEKQIQAELIVGTDVKEAIADNEKNLKAEDIETLYSYLKQSQSISEKIYTRSGVYLLSGCFIAFAGVLFFYFQTSSITINTTITNTDLKQPFDFGKTILEYLPKLGTLIFVEAIAFFFLKQYRVTMEEYRYYEAIKRQRENQVAILKIAKQYPDNDNLIDKIILRCSFNDNPNKLANNETTQVLEANKINLNDSDIMDKLIEIIKVAKK